MDTAPHQRLRIKLKSYGIPDIFIKWIANFLMSRKMRVGVHGKFSERTEITSGVPQGSVWGPLMFITYVNDLRHWITNSMRMLADDAKVCMGQG